jgi:hypothetical protein
MTIEQPASLNFLIEEFRPPTWNARLKLFKLLQPLAMFLGIFGLEKVGLQIWNGTDFSVWTFVALFLTPIWLPMIFLIGNEIQLKIERQSKRLLKVLDKGIAIGRFDRPTIPWSRISVFYFEQISNEPSFSKLTVETSRRRAARNSSQPLKMLGKPPRTIILEKPAQVEQLLSELKRQQQRQNLKFLIELDHLSRPLKESRNAILGMSLYFAGLLFLFNSMPLLIAGCSQMNPQSKPMLYEALAKFILAYFSTVAEWKHFLIMCGGVFAVIGIAMMISGVVVQRQKK